MYKHKFKRYKHIKMYSKFFRIHLYFCTEQLKNFIIFKVSIKLKTNKVGLFTWV
ncbi:hypothetical protein CB17B2768 [Clostridium botulinum B str. Eklund 17B (NRP)]|nr:hypothetical protein CB17B2768 [Clostridium botulinum B str. Eklund 17B (NRP)]